MQKKNNKFCTNVYSARHVSVFWLMSTSKSWGVNGHTTRCTSPVSVVLQHTSGVQLRATGNEDQRLKALEGLFVLACFVFLYVLMF